MTAPSQVSYCDVLRVWREADTIPQIEHAWLFDHLMPIGGDPNGPTFEGWTLLSALAAQTERLRLGPLVTSNRFRPPARLAKIAATVDVVSGGRLDLSVIPAENEEEMVRQANDMPYGLAVGVWTKDIQRAHRVAHALKAGTVWVNSYRTISFNAPFGGYKQSGIGRENGLESLKEYTQLKSVWIELSGQTRDPFTLG
jgi:hypothetical protein